MFLLYTLFYTIVLALSLVSLLARGWKPFEVLSFVLSAQGEMESGTSIVGSENPHIIILTLSLPQKLHKGHQDQSSE